MKPFNIKLHHLVFVFLIVIGCKNSSQNKLSDDEPRRIEILFLGHGQEHHNSRAYMPILASALTKSGINISYTENLKDLNIKNLSKYDGLIIYANHDSISASQEKALLNFVEEGNAFIPIHCASFCFKKSKEYIKLVGGQFKMHGTGVFTAKIVDKMHPIMASIEEFSTWDETYVHDNISSDIEILMERVEGNHHEPWTWVKNYGKGKVFYTAYGHDQKTWSNPNFHNLIKEGILWSVNESVKNKWEEFSKSIPNLVYKDVPNIPNYEKKNPVPKFQMPLSPEESKKLIQVPPGFQLELFASEPDIINPIAMNWDEQGRLWVIETVDYPNTVKTDKGLGDDRIKICEDTNGDGRADKFTIFADKLNIPTGFTFAKGGVIVAQAPYFLLLIDTDNDDVADVRKVLIEGWGTFDTHAGPSNLQYGIDNKIYGSVGYSGFKGNVNGTAFDFGQGIYNFSTDLNNFEFLTSTSNNTWGLGITEDNSIFASTANNTHSVFMGIPNRNFNGVKGLSAEGSVKIDGHYSMLTITPNIRQVDVFGGFTAAAGHHFYTARNYPSLYWNKVAFVCEPTGNIVHIAKIEKKGAGYIEIDGGNLFASADEWVSPVEAKVGPDGAVWVLDWYNFIIQHNPTPTEGNGGFDAKNGDGNAYINPLRDKSRGRVWRVVYKKSIKKDPITLDINKPKELISALSNDNLFWRITAQRLLVERGDKDVLNDLYKLLKNDNVDNLELNPGVLHALWTIQGLVDLTNDSEVKSKIASTLLHNSASIRKATIQMLPRETWVDELLLKYDLLNDKDASVQLQAILYFSERDSSQQIGEILYKLSEQKEIINDVWLSKAVYIAASKHYKGFVNAFMKSNPKFDLTSKLNNQRQSRNFNDSDWQTMTLPKFIEDAGLNIDGLIWFRKTFNISDKQIDHVATLSLGPIDDSDIVYINGIKVGETKQSHQKNRIYKIPETILVKGENTIAIRVEDTGGGGGIYGEKEQLFIKVGNKSISLSGNWKYEVEMDYANKTVNLFKEESIAELLIKTYIDKEELLDNILTDSNKNKKTIHIKVIKNEMKYDLTEFVVEAGESVELFFENTDFMQHNLVITKLGAKEKVGLAADKLATDPKALVKNYVPEIDEVLFFTPIVDPQETYVLKFIAPNKVGEYPFICTFPGHWRIMQGVMKVVSTK